MGGAVTSGFSKDPEEPFRDYVDVLRGWCRSEHAHSKAKAVLEYVRKRKVVADLIESEVLHCDKQGRLERSWQGDPDEIPSIFSLLKGTSTQADAFVRWKVRVSGVEDDTTWSDRSLWQSWESYYLGTRETTGFCYVTGEVGPIAEMHPSKLRHAGDKAKLISSNDSSGFTYRGRFREPAEVCGIGFDVSRKAHSTLRWLIARQGYRDGDHTIVTWVVSRSGTEIVDPVAGTIDVGDDDDEQQESTQNYDAGQHVAIRFRNKLAGYKATLGATDRVVVLALDSATPGRMAITYYRELTGSDYIDRLETWHGEQEANGVVGCVWAMDYGIDKRTGRPLRFTGAPSPRDIAHACYGLRVDPKLRRTTVERVLRCIIDGQALPRDLVEVAARRATNRPGTEPWEWRKNIGIACALYRKYHEERRYEMSLEPGRNSRDYLYGRLLAIAERLERWALSVADERRDTTAARLMQRFADHPFTTWKTIELSLTPYKARLGARATVYLKLLDEVMALFSTDDFVSDRPLSGEFLLGYHCQLQARDSRQASIPESDAGEDELDDTDE